MAAPGGEESQSSDAGGCADGDAAQAWPGHDERLAWAVSARAYWYHAAVGLRADEATAPSHGEPALVRTHGSDSDLI